MKIAAMGLKNRDWLSIIWSKGHFELPWQGEKMRKAILFFAVFCTVFIVSAKVVPLPGLSKPTLVLVNQGQAIIADFPHVYIYNLKDFKLVAKIGKAGEGPKEFAGGLRLQPHPDYVVIGSRMKISYYTRNGKFVKEVRSKTSSAANVYKPLGKNYAAYGGTRENDINFNTINVHDSELKKIKEVIRWKALIQPGRKMDLIDSDFQGGEFRVFDKKIFALIRKKGVITVFDENGDKLLTIEHKYEPVKFTSKDREEFIHYLKTDRRFRNAYEQIQNLLVYPSYYPATREFFVVDGKIYILTNKREGGKSRIVIYDTKGKFIKDIMIPFYNKNFQEFYPFYFKDDTFYQVVDNEDSEEWELHIHPLQ